jgi:hypothetical protein
MIVINLFGSLYFLLSTAYYLATAIMIKYVTVDYYCSLLLENIVIIIKIN